MTRSRLTIAEMATVALLFATALLFARPQLEGWMVFNEFRTEGVGAGIGLYWTMAPTRWLEPIPFAVAWLLGHGRGWGIGAVYGSELLAKYAVIRWGLARRATGTDLWLAATIAAVMPPWVGEWRGHNMAQQLAAFFMLAGLALLVRAADGRRSLYQIGAAVAVLLSLVTYEGLALCAFLLPMTLAAMDDPLTIRSFFARVIRSSTPIFSAVVAYAAISFALLHGTTHSYQAQTFQGQAIADHAGARLSQLYLTSYVGHTSMLPILILLLALSVTASRVAKPFTFFALAALPLLALPYAVSMYALTDPERVTYPLAFGFFLLFVAMRRRNARLDHAHALTVAGLLTFAVVSAFACYRPYLLQRSVIGQVQAISLQDPRRPIRVRDWSGKLGDKYTFIYPAALSSALAVLGSPLPISLCTPIEVDPVRPDIERWAPQVPRCERRPVAVDPLDLDVRGSSESDGVTISKNGGVPTTDGIDLWVTDGTIDGREDDLWWINDPRAVIEIHNTLDRPVTASWQATFYPPPCAEKASLNLYGPEGEQDAIVLDGALKKDFSTVLAPGQTKMVVGDVSSPVCHLPAGDLRPFYMGIVGLHVTAVSDGAE